MRKWGIVITVFYFLILLLFLLPAWVLLAGANPTPTLIGSSFYMLSRWGTWIPIAILVAGQALLLFLSVDTSEKRLKPRTHIRVTITASAMLLALLSFAAIFSFTFGMWGDNFFDVLDQSRLLRIAVLCAWPFLWLFWGIVFYLLYRNSGEFATRARSWLLRGSVLELIIAVISHVIVRRRNDCSAPGVTSFGIVTGIAIMLLSFGPSVLFLLKHRMDARAPRRATS
jgi:hypothetical protein